MKVGDLVWVRFTVISTAPKVLLDRRKSFKLGIIVDGKHADAGMYKVYVAEYNIIEKYFISDLIPVKILTPNYETELED
jgi:hypothetical protein|tara:strand:+ start:186 stop:422 length:237 start_codon:yes stop_codon:yes gene_type:complete